MWRSRGLSKSDVSPKTQTQLTRFGIEYVRSETFQTRSMFGKILKDILIRNPNPSISATVTWPSGSQREWDLIKPDWLQRRACHSGGYVHICTYSSITWQWLAYTRKKKCNCVALFRKWEHLVISGAKFPVSVSNEAVQTGSSKQDTSRARSFGEFIRFVRRPRSGRKQKVKIFSKARVPEDWPCSYKEPK